MISNLLTTQIKKGRTLLGVGPMSKNIVDACIELVEQYNVPLMMISSRRQIDSDIFGGGYVNNWSTERYSNYIRSKSPNNKIILCRDHGGPWQNSLEIKKKYSELKAMESAKRSYESDINSNFKVIHIDTSLDINSTPKIDKVLDRTFELYEHCFSYASKKKKEILFEVGTEEQSGVTNTYEETEYFLNKLSKFCKRNNLPKLFFIVLQSGTKVMETRNIGTFESLVRIKNEIPAEIQIFKIKEICKKYKVYFKQHNTDYLSDDSLNWHPKLGIHAANVAPEFGVAETQNLLNLMKKYKMLNLYDEFIDLCAKSNKWKKWKIDGSKLNDYQKTIICGHYLYSSEKGKAIIDETKSRLIKKNINYQNLAKKIVKKSILRYMNCFKLIGAN
ncbi:MAG: tagatose-6-phosphate kinase [Candidatus Pelagibacter sp. TMED273]|nr:MAG: tagatose-6-phosphate kinase [Candidatus Pelagibacter sp. TMED273]